MTTHKTTSDRMIRVKGCHECDKATHCGGDNSSCRKLDYVDNKNDIIKYVLSKTFHPDCPLEKVEKEKG